MDSQNYRDAVAASDAIVGTTTAHATSAAGTAGTIRSGSAKQLLTQAPD